MLKMLYLEAPSERIKGNVVYKGEGISYVK